MKDTIQVIEISTTTEPCGNGPPGEPLTKCADPTAEQNSFYGEAYLEEEQYAVETS